MVSPIPALLHPANIPGDGYMVRPVIAGQPEGNVYVMYALPGVKGVTIPDALPTLAIDGVPLLHDPPVAALAKVAVAVPHNAYAPVMSGTALLAVTATVAVPQTPAL